MKNLIEVIPYDKSEGAKMDSLIEKIYKATIGLLFIFKHYKKFDLRLLSKKKIALIGPASSAYNTGKGGFIDGFDLVIRINKAPLLIDKGISIVDIGSKTDILVHSFFENEFSGGGPLNFELYRRLGIKYVINPIPTFFGIRATFNFYKKYLLKQPIYSLPYAPYKKAIKPFGRFRPTTGFCALKLAMDSDFSELFITGFTFFKTAYGDGYRDSLKDVNSNAKYIRESNIHNPDIEYDQFKVLLLANRHKRIFTDAELKNILQQDGIQINEA
jgi:Glycosyltransferase family 29 (sialyltransferase)